MSTYGRAAIGRQSLLAPGLNPGRVLTTAHGDEEGHSSPNTQPFLGAQVQSQQFEYNESEIPGTRSILDFSSSFSDLHIRYFLGAGSHI